MKRMMTKLCGCLLALLLLLTAAGCESVVRNVLDTVGDDVGEALTEEQAERLAYGAVLSTRNSMHNRTLFGLSSVYQEAMEESISQSWSITDRDSALETLDWLRDEGHRLPVSEEYYGFDEIYRIISGKQISEGEELQLFSVELEGYEDICRGLVEDYGYTREELDAVNTVSAWDYDRLVTVARWCAGVGYITEDEAWGYIDKAVAMAKADYGDWRAYFAGVLFGRTIWSEDGEFLQEDRDIADQLLLEEDSVYNTATF